MTDDRPPPDDPTAEITRLERALAEARAAPARSVPPFRRVSETRRVLWAPPLDPSAAPTAVFVTVGYGGPDRVRPVEVFFSGGLKGGSELEALMTDICIAVSLMMQHGVDPAGLIGRMTREPHFRTGEPRYASLVGLLLDEIMRPPPWAGEVARIRDEGKRT